MLDAAAAPDTDVPSTAVESPTLPVAPPVADAAVTPGPPGGLPPGDTELSEALAVEPTPAPAAAPQPKLFEVGARVTAQASFDSLYHPADVVGRKGAGDSVQYYVHFVDYNKRVDEWLSGARIQHPQACVDVQPHASSAGAGLTCLIPAVSGLGGLGSPSAGLLSPGCDGMLSPVGSGGDRKLTRNLKRRYDEMHHIARPVEELAPLEQTLEREHEEKTRVKNIMAIELGRHEMDTWYYAPYPEEYAQEHTLLMCEFCLKYMRKRKTLLAHKLRCPCRAPPGTEIYRHPARPGLPALSMWEVDGKKAHTYCQSLCLLAKLFLDHKTLYYDVDPFLFYVLTERDEAGHHLVGYFSKEKASSEEFNLACILTLPPYQRRGYGRFLIAFSYELSKVEGRVGTPERPLSDLGAVSYRSYWTRAVLECLRDHRSNISVKDISARTAIRVDDVVSTLQGLNLLKWWKGQHIIAVTPRLVEDHLRVSAAGAGSAKALDVDPQRLNWVPFGRLQARVR